MKAKMIEHKHSKQFYTWHISWEKVENNEGLVFGVLKYEFAHSMSFTCFVMSPFSYIFVSLYNYVLAFLV